MTLTVASETRREMARRIAPIYASDPQVAAVLLGGSSARGDADRFSDIEIGVLWNEPPSDEQRRLAIERVGGDLHRLYPYDAVEKVWADDWKMGRDGDGRAFSGVSIDMLHVQVTTVEEAIDDVVKRFEPDLSKQNLVAAVRMGICLYGEKLMARWRGQTEVYPRELAAAVVRRFGQIDHFWRLEMWRERQDLTGVHGKIVQVHAALWQMLLAINGIFYFGVKHRETLIGLLEIAPGELNRRMNECFNDDLVAGEETLRMLVEEVYDLVERHVPGVDVKRLREIFRYRRPVWEEAPGR